MKKFLLTITILFVVCAGGLYALMSIDFNRMNADYYYVQINEQPKEEKMKLSNGEVDTRYAYTLDAYDEDGRKEVYEFSADKALRENAYLKLYVKEKGVSSYDEVKLKDIPEKAQLKLK